MAIEIAELPSYKMVDLSIVMWLFTREGTLWTTEPHLKATHYHPQWTMTQWPLLGWTDFPLIGVWLLINIHKGKKKHGHLGGTSAYSSWCMEWDHYNLQRLMGCQEGLFVGFLKKKTIINTCTVLIELGRIWFARNPSKNTHIDYTIDSTKPKTQTKMDVPFGSIDISIWEAMSFPRIK